MKYAARLRRFLDRLFSDPDDLPLEPDSSATLRAIQRDLFQRYRMATLAGAPLPPLNESGYRVFSQTDEDGILVFIFGAIGTTSKTYVEIGGSDGVTGSNCANLALNFGWHGLIIDSSPSAAENARTCFGRHPDTSVFPPKVVCARITRENVNATLREAGVAQEIDLLSIDIDGNDYWIWDALESVSPRVVVIETHVEFGPRPIVVPYDPDYVYPGRNPLYHGASPEAMARLAGRKGFRLVGANRYGWNTFYVRNDLGAKELPGIPVQQILDLPYVRSRQHVFESIKDLPYVTV